MDYAFRTKHANEPASPYIPPPLDTAYIEAVKVRPLDSPLPGECDECARSGLKTRATHLAEFTYTTPAVHEAQGGKFRWLCTLHISQQVNKVQDALYRRST